jgi:imidazole glycerol-phosphate synthase subunit HisH
MIATIFDYGAGNLHSLGKSLERAGALVRVCVDADDAVAGDVLVLPGVGQFSWAAERLGGPDSVIARAIRDGLPTIGICLGMQLLFERSDEGTGEGLGICEGSVTRIDADRVPHIGWNELDNVRDPSLRGAGLTTAYYANSFACRPASDDIVVAWTTHERDRFPAAVRQRNVFGMQFHPEKSSSAGAAALRGVLREVLRDVAGQVTP